MVHLSVGIQKLLACILGGRAVYVTVLADVF